MSFKVVAPLVIAKDQVGLLHHVYEGGVIPWLSDEQAKHFLEEGLVEEVASADAQPSDDDGDEVEVQVGEDGKPLRASNKPALVKWLVDNQTDYPAAELEAMTKEDLWALIDAK